MSLFIAIAAVMFAVAAHRIGLDDGRRRERQRIWEDAYLAADDLEPEDWIRFTNLLDAACYPDESPEHLNDRDAERMAR